MVNWEVDAPEEDSELRDDPGVLEVWMRDGSIPERRRVYCGRPSFVTSWRARCGSWASIFNGTSTTISTTPRWAAGCGLVLAGAAFRRAVRQHFAVASMFAGLVVSASAVLLLWSLSFGRDLMIKEFSNIAFF